MPFVNKKRPYKKEYQQQIARGELPKQLERQRARRAMDAKGIDRTGKDIDHIKPLSKGGTSAAGNLRLKSPSANRSFSRNSDHTIKSTKPTK